MGLAIPSLLDLSWPMVASHERPHGVFPTGLPNLPHLVLRDPAELNAALHRSAPIRHCHSLVPDGSFFHEVAYLDIGSVLLVSQSGTATDFLVEHTPHLHLLAVFGGEISLGTAGGDVNLASQGVALLPSGHRATQGAHSLASLTLSPARVAAAAAAMAGRPRNASQAFPPVHQFPALNLPAGGTAAGAIHSLLRTIDACRATHLEAASQLGFDDVILRCAASLLHPLLLQEEPADLMRYRDLDGRSSFDELIDYIRANLNQPLHLSDLEAKSHYSRRALQYAFRERLNTTPRQWIREQRLALALEELQREGQRLSIKVLALRCGYLQAGQFSRDFKKRYGISPSEVRRL